jgi:dienelactone hydrolase
MDLRAGWEQGMRLLEIVSMCLLAAACVAFWWPRLGRSRGWFLAAAVVALLLHGVLEGPHWQMAPAYLSALVLCCALGSRPRWGVWLAGFGLLLLPAAVVFCLVLPMFELPAPTGPYGVGTAVFRLPGSEQRQDAGPVEVVAQVWYPAQCSGWRRAPYRRWKETTLLSSYQRFVWTHACEDGAVAQTGGKFPVILFNPALDGRRTQSTFLTEELASQGYIVISLDHIDLTGPVELADGKVVDSLPNPIGHLTGVSMEREYQILGGLVNQETMDTARVLEALRDWSADPDHSPFPALARRMDIGRIGSMGHSLGGSVAVEIAVTHPAAPSIRAVFDMSGPLLSQARKEDLQAPFFYMTEPVEILNDAQLAVLGPEQRAGKAIDREIMREIFDHLSRLGGYYLEIDSFDHGSFTDKPLFSSYSRFGGGDPAVIRARFATIRQYAVAFFAQTLRDQPQPLLEQKPGSGAGEDFRHYLPGAKP